MRMTAGTSARRPRLRRISVLGVFALLLTVAPSVAHAADPTISAVSPRRGAVGAKVFIKGSGFSDATDVEFNGKPATFTIRSDTTIRTFVPSGATSGPVTVTAGSTAE